MELPEKFTFPFSYTPHPLVREAAERLIERISSDSELDALFSEGKMLGVLLCSDGDAAVTLHGFSGLAGGRAVVDGFVPPIFDFTDPRGYFRLREAEISEMPPGEERKEASQELQRWLFGQYVVLNARGGRRSVLEVFSDRGLVPPGGTGDCALPKLLQYAYLNGLVPRAFGEFWYGASCGSQVRLQGAFYPSCTGKCGPLLGWMLQGLDVDENPLEKPEVFHPRIVFEDDAVIVVDKPSGMLAVPGKNGQPSLLDWLALRDAAPGRRRRRIYSCHRLDMDTSGLIVFAKTPEGQAFIQRQFENREVGKSYLALLCPGRELPPAGVISLPLSPDYYDRPRQIVDPDGGREAVTEYEVLHSDGEGRTLVRFVPRTGRTHQLRVHAAHSLGLGRPIAGDRLYGGAESATQKRRLYLHSDSLSFVHPDSGVRMEFRSEPYFFQEMNL